ncbi:acyltransferase family protein [Fluviicola taffensis]|uniref:Acyltransferase 3 n=1 Tax=Fluviicola taffensis (strain DSM 16823 / NCIMB 13979 / RW262) TaxID=755732 RepID=F2IIN2_FLUTR|nr:acyltransferase [Fluviicola taffensis]AEA45994.1 acyltransferase 3 [Fluviicola taffensis DSM 16823]
MQQERIHFENLNGLRFIGAFLVFIFHAFTINREVWGSFFESGPFLLFRKLTSIGHYGVNLFFVLSGFLITYLLLNELKEKGKIHIGFFLVRRILRLWPLYFVLVIFGFFIFPLLPFGVQTIHEFWRYALFLSNFDEIIHGSRDSLNFLTATWSVSIEEQFYIIWALFIGLFQWKTIRSFRIFFLIIVFGSFFFRWYYSNNVSVLYYHTLSVISDMAMGGLLATWVFKKSIISSVQELKKWKIALIYLMGISFLFFASHILPGKFIALERLVSGAFFSFVLLEQLQAKYSFYKADRIPYFERAGKLTYGFYLFHSLMIFYLCKSFETLEWNQHIEGFIAYFILLLVINSSLSILSYRYFEKPLLNLKRYFRV